MKFALKFSLVVYVTLMRTLLMATVLDLYDQF